MGNHNYNRIVKSSCSWENHKVSKETKDYIKLNLPYQYDVKCEKCDNWLRLVHEYDDCYFMESIGFKKLE